MIKALRSPEKLFATGMWLISFVFAGFLIGLGGRIIADLPRVDGTLSADQFADQALLADLRARMQQQQEALRLIEPRRAEAQAQLEARQQAWRTAQDAHQNWLNTRRATASSASAEAQDPELLRRNAQIDALLAARQQAREALDAVVAEEREARQQFNELDRLQGVERERVRPAFESARGRQELRVFGLRLLLTLPLLTLAGWMVARKRQSPHWPLLRGFVVFAAFTFFFELMPYLPSYGGYVRYGVGIVLCVVAGRAAIGWMQRYLNERQAAEQRSEQERRASLDAVSAITKMAANVCPGCERIIVSPQGTEVNHCVYCGLRLFDRCGGEVATPAGQRRCDTRKNAFFPHCPSCGTPSQRPLSGAVSAPGSTPATDAPAPAR